MPNRRCRLFHVDAFTRQRFCGNPAIVVLDADELSEEQMQTIATEVNGETAFVLEAEASDHDMQVRFFTPRHEVPFVGHATIAAQYVRAKKDGKPAGKVRQRTGAGIVRNRSHRCRWRLAHRHHAEPAVAGPGDSRTSSPPGVECAGHLQPEPARRLSAAGADQGRLAAAGGVEVERAAGLDQARFRGAGAAHFTRRRRRLFRVRFDRARRRSSAPSRACSCPRSASGKTP